MASGAAAATLSDLLLYTESGDTAPEVHLCHIDVSSGISISITNLIPITFVEGSLLIAAPHAAWHRTIARRFLPQNSLARVVLLEVPAESESGEEVSLKVWVGYLAAEFVGQIVFYASGSEEALTFVDGSGAAASPTVESLVKVANEQFGFYSAESQLEAEEAAEPAHPVEDRVHALEEQLGAIQQQLLELPGKLKESTSAGKERSGNLKKGAQPRYSGLDPGVLASARVAGIPEAQLAKLAELVSKPPRMTEPTRKPVRSKNILSESEEEDIEEEAEPEKEEDSSPTQAVQKAVVQLTKLVASMTQQKKNRHGLEGIFDKIEGSSSDPSSSSSSSRSKAAAYQRLKAALVDRPEWLFQSIEERMGEDFNQTRSAPNTSTMSTTSRGWVEHRSKVGHYPATIRLMWLLGGIHDCLKNGEVNQARARCALALAAADQASIDNGNWSLAHEFLLELPPPYAAFSNRRPTDFQEQVSTRLTDERFIEIMMWRLKDRDAYIEARKRLNQNQPKAKALPATPPGREPRPNPKQQPKAKPKTKAAAAPEEGAGQEG